MLRAANGTLVSTYSQKSWTLNLNLRKTFRWIFVIAKVQQSILGAEFLEHLNHVLDLRNRCLVDVSQGLRWPRRYSTHSDLHRQPSFSPSLGSPIFFYRNFLSFLNLVLFTLHCNIIWRTQFCSSLPSCTKEAQGCTCRVWPSASIRHYYPSKSAWSSPLYPVSKGTPGDWSPCRDYRAQNAATVPDRYYLPYIQDYTSHLHGCYDFSKVELVCVYHQILFATVRKTAVKTHLDCSNFVVCPMDSQRSSDISAVYRFYVP